MDDHPVHTIQIHQHPKMDVLPKTVVQILLAAKWLVRPQSKYSTPAVERPRVLNLINSAHWVLYIEQKDFTAGLDAGGT